MKIECVLLSADHSCNICSLRSKCFKVWKYAAFDLSSSYHKALDHIVELKEEIDKLIARINEIENITTVKILQEDLNNDKNRG